MTFTEPVGLPELPQGMTRWGKPDSSESTTKVNHVRALGGMSPDRDTLLKAVSILLPENDGGSVRLAVYAAAAGGIADVNDSTTSYRNCIVHDNAGAAFYFSGQSHAVTDSLIFNQSEDFSVQRGTDLNRDQIDWRDPKRSPSSD